MSTTAIELPDALRDPDARRGSLVRDSWVVARRGLWHMRRQPEALADATFQPVMFVLLFAYVFGGAISVPGGGDYKEFLMGGIFAQSIVFGGSFGVAMGIAADRTNGAMDRFRSLPLARGSVLGGHALANMIKAFLPMLLMSLCGLIIGWRIRGGVGDAVAAYALLALFAFAMIWIGVLMGSMLASPEAVQGVAFVAIFPLTFIASTFVPSQSLPGVLRTFAQWNPVSTLADSLRVLFGNPHDAPGPDTPWPLHHPVLYTLIACVVIIAVCAPLAVARYQKSIED
ncbi:MAG TPA: ABC transporter permease [Solirubrobacteraceae bacterium]|jgi:ABC transporter DrrB family efflux protein